MVSSKYLRLVCEATAVKLTPFAAVTSTNLPGVAAAGGAAGDGLCAMDDAAAKIVIIATTVQDLFTLNSSVLLSLHAVSSSLKTFPSVVTQGSHLPSILTDD